jgi:anthranilate synthase
MPQLRYITPHGIAVTRTNSKVPYHRGLGHLLKQLDTKRGVYLSSGYEYPERYSRWDVASVAPALEMVARERRLELRALNQRGEVLLCLLDPLLKYHPHRRAYFRKPDSIRIDLRPLADKFPEEERSKQPSPFSILRTLVEEFRNPEDSRLCLIGAFGYELLLQFDPIRLRLPRGRQKDIHLFLCDDIYFMDRQKEIIERFQYDFAGEKGDTRGLPRTASRLKAARASGMRAEITSDHTPEEYIAKVETVREGMRQGNYYEVVLRQTFSAVFD